MNAQYVPSSVGSKHMQPNLLSYFHNFGSSSCFPPNKLLPSSSSTYKCTSTLISSPVQPSNSSVFRFRPSLFPLLPTIVTRHRMLRGPLAVPHQSAIGVFAFAFSTFALSAPFNCILKHPISSRFPSSTGGRPPRQFLLVSALVTRVNYDCSGAENIENDSFRSSQRRLSHFSRDRSVQMIDGRLSADSCSAIVANDVATASRKEKAKKESWKGAGEPGSPETCPEGKKKLSPVLITVERSRENAGKQEYGWYCTG